MLAAGIDPAAPIQAFAVTTGNRWWHSPRQPLIGTSPPGLDVERFVQSIHDLRATAGVPPSADRLVFLAREEPCLPDAS
jgi:hypothetical protein